MSWKVQQRHLYNNEEEELIYWVTQTLYFYKLEYRILRNQNRLKEAMFLGVDFKRELKSRCGIVNCPPRKNDPGQFTILYIVPRTVYHSERPLVNEPTLL